jgi:hypothetical protein
MNLKVLQNMRIVLTIEVAAILSTGAAHRRVRGLILHNV